MKIRGWSRGLQRNCMDECSRWSRGDQSEGKLVVKGVTEKFSVVMGEKRMGECTAQSPSIKAISLPYLSHTLTTADL